MSSVLTAVIVFAVVAFAFHALMLSSRSPRGWHPMIVPQAATLTVATALRLISLVFIVIMIVLSFGAAAAALAPKR